MNRGLWFVAGAGAAIYVVIRGRRAAEALTIDGMQDRLNGLAVGVADVPRRGRQGQGRGRNRVARAVLPLLPHGAPELTTAPTRQEEEGRG